LAIETRWKNMTGNAFDIVTGGGGFIGSHLVDALAARGRAVKVIDNFAVGRRANLARHYGNPKITIIDADVSDAARMMAEVAGSERIFHLAALADIVPSVENPTAYYNANVTGTLVMLEAARAHGVGRFLYTASSSCYGIPERVPTPETAPIQPRYPYALTKYLGEELVLHWAALYGLPAVSVRFFNIYGPRARTSGTYGAVFGVFLAQLLAGQPLTVVGDGTQTRDFTFVSDAVSGILAVSESGVSGEVFNVGTGAPVSVNRLVELLGATQTVTLPKRPGEPDVTHADVAKIRRRLGWEARVPIEEGVQVMLEQIDYWRDAPVWTPERIESATQAWFKYLKS
jgi:UDP-glucose 4-epimerase